MRVQSKFQSFGLVSLSSLVWLGFGFVDLTFAEENDWHLDLGVQVADLEGRQDELSLDYDATIVLVSGHIGYRVLSFFSIEGEFGFGLDGEEDIGTFDPTLNFFAPPPVFDIKQSYIIGLSGRLQHDFGDDLFVFAKGGVLQSEYELQSRSPNVTASDPLVTEMSIDDIGYSIGIGAEYYFSEHSGIRADLTQYDVGIFESTALSIGYSHRF